VFKLQLATQRIEEDKEEDEDDSTPSKDFMKSDADSALRQKQQPPSNKSLSSINLGSVSPVSTVTPQNKANL